MKHYKIESNFQADLKKEIETLFPGAVIMKNDPNDIQGIPDLTVIWRDHWAWLECKTRNKCSQTVEPRFLYSVCTPLFFRGFYLP